MSQNGSQNFLREGIKMPSLFFKMVISLKVY